MVLDPDLVNTAKAARKETTIVYWAYIGIMEKKMETVGIIGIICKRDEVKTAAIVAYRTALHADASRMDEAVVSLAVKAAENDSK